VESAGISDNPALYINRKTSKPFIWLGESQRHFGMKSPALAQLFIENPDSVHEF
jgi:hypothetical protein